MISDRDFIQEKAMSRQFCLFRDLTNCLAATNLGMQYIFISEKAVSQAIERILEAKGMLADENAELERQYEIFKRIRMQRAEER